MPASNSFQLGSAIRALRKKRRLTIEALASAAGVHTTYLSGIELGRRNPTWKVVGKLANALGVEISELSRRAEQLPPNPNSKS